MLGASEALGCSVLDGVPAAAAAPDAMGAAPDVSGVTADERRWAVWSEGLREGGWGPEGALREAAGGTVGRGAEAAVAACGAIRGVAPITRASGSFLQHHKGVARRGKARDEIRRGAGRSMQRCASPSAKKWGHTCGMAMVPPPRLFRAASRIKFKRSRTLPGEPRIQARLPIMVCHQHLEES